MTTTPVPPQPPVATQSKHPWHATFRTIFATVIGLASSYSAIVWLLHLNPSWHWVAVGAVVAGGVTRVMANPFVDSWLNRNFPWLSSQPKHKPEHRA